MLPLLVTSALLIGALMPFQSLINAELSTHLGSPLQSALVSFSVGMISLFLITIFSPNAYPSFSTITKIPPLLFIGGFFGVLMVGASIVLVPKMGSALMMGGFVCGQILMSLIIDHYGWMGVPVNPLSMTRLAGGIFMLIGLGLFFKG